MAHTGQEPNLVVVGAGAAGMACALEAARRGRRVLLLEQTAAPGGTVARALIHTLGGLLDEQGEVINPGLAGELVQRLRDACPHTTPRRIGKTMTLSVDPAIYQRVVRDWLGEFPHLELRTGAEVRELSVRDGMVTGVRMAHGGSHDTIPVTALVDTTGHAALVRLAGAPVVDGEVLAGWVCVLRGVAPGALQFPRNIALLKRLRKAVEARQLPAECATLWLDSGVYPDEAYLKFNLPPETWQPAHLHAVVEKLVAYLRLDGGFQQAVLHARGELGLREGGRTAGCYTLSEEDLRQGRRFGDAVCQGNWPIEYWSAESGVKLDYFPPGHRYEIPLGALRVDGLENLFIAGKCLSAEPRAQASTRVAGTCWGMGAGLARVLCNGASAYEA